MLDKKEAKDYDISNGWGSDKADAMSRIAFCIRYGKRFSTLVESLEKSLYRYQNQQHSKDIRNDIDISNDPEKNSSQDMTSSF